DRERGLGHAAAVAVLALERLGLLEVWAALLEVGDRLFAVDLVLAQPAVGHEGREAEDDERDLEGSPGSVLVHGASLVSQRKLARGLANTLPRCDQPSSRPSATKRVDIVVESRGEHCPPRTLLRGTALRNARAARGFSPLPPRVSFR